MKFILALTLLIAATVASATVNSRQGANDTNKTAAFGEGKMTTDIQEEEEDLMMGTQAKRDQQRRKRESERELVRLRKEESIRRNQRSGINNGFVP